MNNYFLVLSNLKHDGGLFEKGSILEAAEGAFEGLVKSGILRLVEGAKSIEHAAELAAAEVTAAAAKAGAVAKPKDTWAASPEKPVAVAAEVAETAPAATEDAQKPAEEAQAAETTEAEKPVVGEGDVAPAATEGADL